MLPLPPIRTTTSPTPVRNVLRALDSYTLWAFNPQHHLVRGYVEPTSAATEPPDRSTSAGCPSARMRHGQPADRHPMTGDEKKRPRSARAVRRLILEIVGWVLVVARLAALCRCPVPACS